MAEDSPTKHRYALLKLQAMLSLVLTEIGRVYDNPSRRNNPGSAARSKNQLRASVGEARLHFQDALDELEAELSRARDVMRRDLGSIIEEQRRKEDTNGVSAPDTAQATAPAESEDVHMADAPTNVKEEAGLGTTAAPIASPSDLKAEADNTTTTNGAPNGITAPEDPSKGTATTSTTAPDGTLNTSAPAIGTDDLDFDSMFAGLGPSPDEGALDIDGGGPIGFDLGEAAQDLLPGLESYASLGETDAGASTTQGQQQQPIPTDGAGDAAATAGAGVSGGGDAADPFADLLTLGDMEGLGDGELGDDFNDLFNELGGA